MPRLSVRVKILLKRMERRATWPGGERGEEDWGYFGSWKPRIVIFWVSMEDLVMEEDFFRSMEELRMKGSGQLECLTNVPGSETTG